MIDFSKITRVTIPEGVAIEIQDGNGNLVWDAFHMRYVSLGDSIAAGHSINEYWATNYGVGSQYGENGNTSTEIVPKSYTDLIKNKLEKSYDPLRVSTKSFAHSGDTVENLIAKLNHDRVKGAILRANIVTICIGANNVLVPAMASLNNYIMSGDLTEVNAKIDSSLGTLTSGNSSYLKLFELLNDETNGNPNAKYVFTTIYNPYKYLHIDEGANGFFKPLLDGIKGAGLPDWMATPIANGLLSTDIFKQVFARVNNLSSWTETWVTNLNNVLKEQVAIYNGNTTNKNIFVADTKALFDTFPDRGGGRITYDMLVNVEYTAGFKLPDADWGQLWEPKKPYNFFYDLANKHGGILSFDLEGFATELVTLMIERVFAPDVDPHPEEDGQYVLSRSFENAAGLNPLGSYKIVYKPNGGLGTMDDKIVPKIDELPAYSIALDPIAFTPPKTGYRFVGWKDQYGNSYSNGQVITLTSDLTLTAQWIEQVTLTYYKTYGIDSNLHSGHPASSSTGPVYKNGVSYPYYLNIMVNGESITQGINDTFTNNGNSPTYTMQVDKGSTIKISLVNEKSGDKCEIWRNGTRQVGPLEYADYEFSIQNNTTLQCMWCAEGYSALGVTYLTQSYWIVGISG